MQLRHRPASLWIAGCTAFALLAFSHTASVGQAQRTTAYSTSDLSNVRSSVECVSEPGNPLYQMCTYHNIIVYGLDVIYISDVPVELPKFDVTWLAIDDSYKLMHVKVMSPAELGLGPDVQVEQINQAAFWFFGTADNYGHCLGEYAPSLHNLICKLLGLCTYDPAADLRIFRLNQAHIPGENPFPAAINEAWKCFTPSPVLHLGHAAYDKKAFLVSNGVAGIGAECRAFLWCDANFGRRPLSLDVMKSFQHRLGQCIGWDDSALVPRDPMRVVIFDRKLESRRAILNIAGVQNAICVRYPAAEVNTVYAEDMSFKQQALAAASASILILIHGASLANFLFLPKGSVGIHIVGDPGYIALHQWIRDFARDLPQKPTVLEMTNEAPWRMHVVPTAILQDGIYQNLDHQQQRDFWTLKTCPAEPQEAADKCRHVWLVKQLNLDLDVAQLMGFIERGVDIVQSFKPPAAVQYDSLQGSPSLFGVAGAAGIQAAGGEATVGKARSMLQPTEDGRMSTRPLAHVQKGSGNLRAHKQRLMRAQRSRR
ncbi:hypothetical protein WJX84_005466 [Apatococcus fuscideae]|uniref:Glycosyltransferase 61 catalytic domain-containing protein n=1 Tax=Apatococcus fuscideae TaxID=2026836 RepID=A0AAW1SUK3_9CHLO